MDISMVDFQMVIICAALQHKSRMTLGEPGWSEALFWLISFTPIVCIPAWFCYYTCPRGIWQVTCIFSIILTVIVLVCYLLNSYRLYTWLFLLLHLSQRDPDGNTYFSA